MDRPEYVRIVRERCTSCCVCRELVPEFEVGGPVRVSTRVLEAMAECPGGAIRWCEPEEES